MLDSVVARAPIFLLVVARCFALIMSLPLFSSKTVPRLAKFALAFAMAYCVFPRLSFSTGLFSDYSEFVSLESFSLEYILIIVGEVFIGLIIGFYINIIFGAFSTAGQFFAFQIGFAASSVYDSMSEVENPLLGQYLNFIAMLVFLCNYKFLDLFTKGIELSFESISVFSMISNTHRLAIFMMKGLTNLFANALIISLPMIGCLFLINVTMGILAKAAPQMNLLAEGFPVLILCAFFLLTSLLPSLIEFFSTELDRALDDMKTLFMAIRGVGI